MADSINMPIARREFERMARYGRTGQRRCWSSRASVGHRLEATEERGHDPAVEFVLEDQVLDPASMFGLSLTSMTSQRPSCLRSTP